MRTAATALALVGLLAVAGCGSARPTRTTTRPSFASPRTQQIALARAHEFGRASIFPTAPGKRRCVIPAGRSVFRGVCTTNVHRADSHEPELVVAFTEQWSRPSCPRNGYCTASARRTARHTWQVTEGERIPPTTTSRLRVVATRETGATAPQMYK